MDSPSRTPPQTLPKVIGQNVRAIRTGHGWTQEEVAASCRAAGLKWGYRRVLELESGMVAAGLPTLLRVVAALDSLTPPGEPAVTLSRLLHTTNEVRLGDVEDETAPGLLVARLVSGDEPGRKLQPHLRPYGPSDRDGKTPQPGLSRTDFRMSTSLGLSATEFLEVCFQLWGNGMEAERNRRERLQGPGPLNAAERGWITNELRRELEKKLDPTVVANH